MNERTEYTIKGEKYYQDFLTVDETVRLAKVLINFKFDQKASIRDIFFQIYEQGKLDQVFEIVLKGEKTIKAGDIPLKVALQIVQDFFSSNDILMIITTFTSLMENVTNSVPVSLTNFVPKKPAKAKKPTGTT